MLDMFTNTKFMSGYTSDRVFSSSVFKFVWNNMRDSRNAPVYKVLMTQDHEDLMALKETFTSEYLISSKNQGDKELIELLVEDSVTIIRRLS